MGKEVLELGAGTGLVTIVASLLGKTYEQTMNSSETTESISCMEKEFGLDNGTIARHKSRHIQPKLLNISNEPVVLFCVR